MTSWIVATAGNARITRSRSRCEFFVTLIFLLLSLRVVAEAQVNVPMAHNDLARTGQNVNERILTPANVNPAQFGKLFSLPLLGAVIAQPLYVSQLAIPGKGTHNVVYVVTSSDYVYAFDADCNGGVDAQPLWSVSLASNTTKQGVLESNFGVVGTPVIDVTAGTLFLVSSEMQGLAEIYRLHGLNITNGAERSGSPMQLQGSVPGTGDGSVQGVLAFDANAQYQRPGLLLLNGVVYVPFGSVNDNGPWHGWIFSYNAATLELIDALCLTPNGVGGGLWMGGAGLAAEVNDPAKPYGRMFVPTGNGSYQASVPYSVSMNFSMSVLDLDLTGGKITVDDEFTPYNWQSLDAQDGDVGSGGLVLLPEEMQSSGTTLSGLVQVGKSGEIYILDRNKLGGFNAGGDQVVQEIQTPVTGQLNWGAGIWGTSAYWNGYVYFGGTNPGSSNSLTAYSFTGGRLSPSPVSQSSVKFSYPSPSPSISANGNANGIVWVMDTSAYDVPGGAAKLIAFNASNLANALYSTEVNFSRDNPGDAYRFTVPTIANGKVYAGAVGQLSVYGLLGTLPTVAAPVFNPPSNSFTGSQNVKITDATGGAQIFYTTDGSTPTVNSNLYSGPITLTSTTTLNAIASATGYLQGAPISATYTSTANAATPLFSLAGGNYAGKQSLTITDKSTGAKLYYTVDGTTPNASSAICTGPVSVAVSETVRAVAIAPGLLPSAVASQSYEITPVYNINFSGGFSGSAAAIQYNGSTDLDDFRLQLTNGGMFEAGSAFDKTPVNVQSFTTDFIFQLSNPEADGITFAIQRKGPTALGTWGGGLGYAGISTSAAIKFDLHNDAGEGMNSTGLYLNGAPPTVPSVDLTNTGIDLHSGDQMEVHITYDGTNLVLTLTDVLTLATWSRSFAVDIPAAIGGSTAYVGFTGGTGLVSSSQKITYWTYLTGAPAVPNYPTGFDSVGLVMNGSAAISGTTLRLTNGGMVQQASAYYGTPVDVASFSATFDFQLTKAFADGFTFVIQNQGANALGTFGEGLGYATIPHSVAIKFDIYNNAGEGDDSTGVFVNGALPTVPSDDLTPSNIELASGDVIEAQITYDGTTLIWTLTDLTDNDLKANGLHSTSHSIPIDIPHTIGSNTAYAGFTGGTGGKSAIQDILNWTFTNP